MLRTWQQTACTAGEPAGVLQLTRPLPCLPSDAAVSWYACALDSAEL